MVKTTGSLVLVLLAMSMILNGAAAGDGSSEKFLPFYDCPFLYYKCFVEGIPYFCELYYQRCPISQTVAKPPAA
jgi:hypothetical protein